MRTSASITRLIQATAVAVVALWGTWVHAQATDEPLISRMEAFVVTTDADGAEQLTKTSVIKPGETIEYVITYTNRGDRALSELKLSGPVPDNTVYLAGSATTSPRPLFSIDEGSAYQPEPVKYKVKQADGTVVEKIAAPEMYTHVRWEVARLDPGASTTCRYRVSVK